METPGTYKESLKMSIKIRDSHIEELAAALIESLNKVESLRAALTEAHRVILHEMDSGRTPYLLKAENGGKGLGYLEDTLSGVTR